MASAVQWFGGDPTGESFQKVNVTNTHEAKTGSTHYQKPSGAGTKASQLQRAKFTQKGTAEGEAGSISINHFLDADGTQDQYIGSGVGTKRQEQSLGLAADQILIKTGGTASGEAFFDIKKLTQEQYGKNAAGFAKEISTIGGQQYATFSGQAGSDGSIVNSMAVQTTQSQKVSQGRPPYWH